MVLVTIKTFSNSAEAHICKNNLEAEGVRCFINNETIIDTNPLLKNAFGGYQLQCLDKDSEKARQLVNGK